MNHLKTAFLLGAILMSAACTAAPEPGTTTQPSSATARGAKSHSTLTGSIVITSEAGNISLIDMASPETLTDLIDPPGSFSATWSPDGTRLAYITFQRPPAGQSWTGYDPSLRTTDVLAIWGIDRDGHNRVQLSSSAPGDRWQEGFAWSPDGEWIAAVKVQWLAATTSGGGTSGEIELGPTTLNLIRTDGSGEIRTLGPAKAESAIQWLPDGKHLVLLTSDGDLDVLDLDSNLQDRIVINAFEQQGTNFAVSPDGKWLAFLRSGRDAYGLWLHSLDAALQGEWAADIMLLNGEYESQTLYIPQAGDLSWSPNGELLLFTSIADSRVQLHLVRADGSGSVTAAEYGECLEPIDQPLLCWPYSMRPGFSPDSKWIVYNVGRMGYEAPPEHGLYIVSVADALSGHPNPTKLPLKGYQPQWQP